MTSEMQVGRFVLHERLGHGASSTVYRAWDPVMGSEVALKFLLPYLSEDRLSLERFQREARLLARVRHPNIVAFYGIEEAGGQIFIVMERVIGRTLAELLADGEPLPFDQVVTIVRAIGAAIDYLHAEGLVHRDIKASNVMLDQSGRVLLMDLGIARTATRSAELTSTLTSAMAGTPQTMAPEQVLGQPVGQAADIYALGVVTYQMLAGRPPFEGHPAAVMYAQVHEAPPALHEKRPDLAESICQVVGRALAKSPEDRPASAAEFVQAFTRTTEDVTASQSGSAEPAAASERTSSQQAVSQAASAAPVASARSGLGGVAQRHLRLLGIVIAVLALGGGIAAVRVLGSLRPSHAGEAVSDFAIYYVGTWAQGQGSLQGCFNVWSHPAGGFRFTVLSAADGSALAAGDLTRPGKLSENQCLTVGAGHVIAPGGYRAELLDGAGRQLASLEFSVVGPLKLRGIADWAGSSAPLQGCVDRGDDDPALTLQLTVMRDDEKSATFAGARMPTETGGSACLSVPVQAQLDPGVYRASIFDAAGRELGRSTFDVVANVKLEGLDAWLAGAGELRICFDKGAGLATSSLTGRVASADLHTPAWNGSQAATSDPGHTCATIASAGSVPPGSYRASIIDSLGREVVAAAFSVPQP